MRREWFGRRRVAVLAALGLAALLDATMFGVLVNGDDDAVLPQSPPAATSTGPDVVARSVVQAVADGDCSAIGDLIAADATLPSPLVACLAGTPTGAVFSDVRVLSAAVVDDTADVTVAVSADGAPAEITVELRRDGDTWLVRVVRPTA